MKIALIIYNLSNGGAERVVSRLSKEFAKKNEVDIILFSNEIFYEYKGKIISLEVPSVKSNVGKLLNFIKRVFKLKRILKANKYDKIYSFMESANLATIIAGEEVIISVRNNPLRFNRIFQVIMKILYRFKNVKKIVAVSKEIEEILKKNFNLKNTATIYNPIEKNFFEKYKIKENLETFKPFILSIGRLHYQKNFELLINAFANSKVKDYLNLVIVGEGKERDKLENLIKNFGLEKKIFLVGKTNNVLDFYLQCEMFVLSSRYEGFPNVLVEALSMGCACISTNCPTGPNEIIKHRINGLLVENENQKELIKALEEVYFNDDLRIIIKNNAKKSVEHLKIENIAKKWLKI